MADLVPKEFAAGIFRRIRTRTYGGVRGRLEQTRELADSKLDLERKSVFYQFVIHSLVKPIQTGRPVRNVDLFFVA